MKRLCWMIILIAALTLAAVGHGEEFAAPVRPLESRRLPRLSDDVPPEYSRSPRLDEERFDKLIRRNPEVLSSLRRALSNQLDWAAQTGDAKVSAVVACPALGSLFDECRSEVFDGSTSLLGRDWIVGECRIKKGSKMTFHTDGKIDYDVFVENAEDFKSLSDWFIGDRLAYKSALDSDIPKSNARAPSEYSRRFKGTTKSEYLRLDLKTAAAPQRLLWMVSCSPPVSPERWYNRTIRGGSAQ